MIHKLTQDLNKSDSRLENSYFQLHDFNSFNSLIPTRKS